MEELRKCKRCGDLFNPQSGRQLYCHACKDLVNRERALAYYRAHKEGKREYMKTYNHEYYQGVRRGYNQAGENNNNYVDGARAYQKVIGNKCEHCGSIRFLVVHHRDHNHYNNDPDNLETLCKSCHQKEHEVWRNFTKGIVRSSENSKSDE